MRNFGQLRSDGLRITPLRLYNNLGYAAPTAEEFAAEHAGAAITSPNWLCGGASWDASVTGDPRGYPDVHFWIDEAGVIREINGVPHATMNRMVQFARDSEDGQ